MTNDARIAEHYSPGTLLERLDAALTAAGKDPLHPTLEDLAPVDQFHSGGAQATEKLADLAIGALGSSDHGSQWKVLDLGGGIGGPARMLAERFGCLVTVLDLSSEFCTVGAELTRRVGLDRWVKFQQGSALKPPFADSSFDLVWTQHASMNIADKAELYEKAYRLLKPGGRLAIHDIMAGPKQPIHFPVAWATRADLSALATPDEVRKLIAEAGFDSYHWQDMTDTARASFASRLEAYEKSGEVALSLNLVIGNRFPQVMRNMLRNADEHRIVSAMGVWRKPEFGD